MAAKAAAAFALATAKAATNSVVNSLMVAYNLVTASAVAFWSFGSGIISYTVHSFMTLYPVAVKVVSLSQQEHRWSTS